MQAHQNLFKTINKQQKFQNVPIQQQINHIPQAMYHHQISPPSIHYYPPNKPPIYHNNNYHHHPHQRLHHNNNLQQSLIIQPSYPIQDKPQIVKKSSKMQIVSAIDKEDKQKDFDLNLMAKAMNNSYICRLSGDTKKYKASQLAEILMDNDFIDYLPKSKQKNSQNLNQTQWKDYDQTPYFIVQIDEQQMQGIRDEEWGLFSCGRVQNKTQKTSQFYSSGLQPNSNLKLYSLVFQMGALQIHLQSFETRNKRIFLNSDLVHLQITGQELLPQKKQQCWRYPIILNCLTSKPLKIPVYITERTLPYPLSKEKLTIKNSNYLQRNYQKLYLTFTRIIEQSHGKKIKAKKIQEIILKNQYKFFEKRNVTVEQFQQYCETGDLLLFKGKHFMGKMQRVFTNSQYDHVGIVYRSQQYGICLFQSNSGLGVAMAVWRHLVRFKWYEGLEGIVWRKLKLHDRPQNFQKKVTEFIKGNLHKQFGLNLPKLLKFKSVTITHDGSDKKSYFCSQLVATLYKYLGILQKTKSATQYWPKDFADDSGLEILNGALDPCREIIFQEDLTKIKHYQIK